MPVTPVVTEAPQLLSILKELRHVTLRGLCDEIAVRTGCSFYRCYDATRAVLDQLVMSGQVLCWSIAKPLFVCTEDAAQVREDLKAALYRTVCAWGQATPGKLKSVKLCGTIVAMDLLQELAQELIDEGKIENVGRKGMGRTKIYVPVGDVAQLDMDLSVTGQVLRYLKALHERNFFRETAANICAKLKLSREDVNGALAHLEERGLIDVIQHEGGFLRFYAFAANTMVIRQVDPSTLTVAQTAYAEVEPAAAVVVEDAVRIQRDAVRPAAGVVRRLVTALLGVLRGSVSGLGVVRRDDGECAASVPGLALRQRGRNISGNIFTSSAPLPPQPTVAAFPVPLRTCITSASSPSWCTNAPANTELKPVPQLPEHIPGKDEWADHQACSGSPTGSSGGRRSPTSPQEQPHHPPVLQHATMPPQRPQGPPERRVRPSTSRAWPTRRAAGQAGACFP